MEMVETIIIGQLLLYVLLETYCFERGIQNFFEYKRLSAKQTWDFDVLNVKADCRIVEEKTYTRSSIEHSVPVLSFIKEIKNEVNSVNAIHDTEEDLDLVSLDNSVSPISQYDEYLMVEEMIVDPIDVNEFESTEIEESNSQSFVSMEVEKPLLMDDLEEVINQQEIQEELKINQTGKIAAANHGMQVWTVSVIGIEQNFVHVSDGERLWLDFGKKANAVLKGDILSLLVNRVSNTETILENVELLQRVSVDYQILDGNQHMPDLYEMSCDSMEESYFDSIRNIG
jgi:hypothetical protein